MRAKAYIEQAEALLEREGERALLVAAHRATTKRLAGDHSAAQLWENVVEAVLQLRADVQGRAGQTRH